MVYLYPNIRSPASVGLRISPSYAIAPRILRKDSSSNSFQSLSGLVTRWILR